MKARRPRTGIGTESGWSGQGPTLHVVSLDENERKLAEARLQLADEDRWRAAQLRWHLDELDRLLNEAADRTRGEGAA